MKEELTPKELKGFNAGYLIAKHDPELFKVLEKSLGSESEYIQGLKYGKLQADRENLLEQIKGQKKSADRNKDR